MNDFTTYTNNIINDRIIDCHIHLFDANGETPLNHNIKRVGFMDIWFNELDRYTKNQSEVLYNKYINEGLLPFTTLCATAPDPDQIIHIYEKHTPYIKGFGELKCYDYTFSDKIPQKLEFKDLKWVNELCNYNIMNLPIYIHYSLDKNNYKQLEELFKNYPNIPFILCHCGIGTNNEYGFSIQDNPHTSLKLAIELSTLDNVYLDISFTAMDYLCNLDYYSFNNILQHINPKKILLGTDENNQQFRSEKINGYELYQKQKRNFLILYKYFGNWNYINYRKLFNKK